MVFIQVKAQKLKIRKYEAVFYIYVKKKVKATYFCNNYFLFFFQKEKEKEREKEGGREPLGVADVSGEGKIAHLRSQPHRGLTGGRSGLAAASCL